MRTNVEEILNQGLTINGRLIVKAETTEENWARLSVQAIHYRLICCATNDSCVEDKECPELFVLAAALEANLNNPIHYGDNEPGLYTAAGLALLPNPSFTFMDLWEYGLSGEDGFAGFLRDCGLPKESTRQSIIAVIGLLLLDAALVAIEDGRPHWASHLISQAYICEGEALLWKLGGTKQDEIQAAIRHEIKARGAKAVQARYAKDSDGKQAIKRWVKECWQGWKAKPEKYKNASAFARDMLDKQPDRLTTEVVVTRWVREWEKEEIAL